MTLSRHITLLDELTEKLETLDNKRKKVLDFMEHSPAICFLKNAFTGRYEYVNKAIVDTMGWEQITVVGKKDIDLYPESVASMLSKYDDQVYKTKESVTIVERLPAKGGWKNFLVTKFIVINGDVSIGGVAIEIPDTYEVKVA